MPERVSRAAPSSPSRPSAGRSPVIKSTRIDSAARSASETGSVADDLVSSPLMVPYLVITSAPAACAPRIARSSNADVSTVVIRPSDQVPGRSRPTGPAGGWVGVTTLARHGSAHLHRAAAGGVARRSAGRRPRRQGWWFLGLLPVRSPAGDGRRSGAARAVRLLREPRRDRRAGSRHQAGHAGHLSHLPAPVDDGRGGGADR